MSFTILPDVIKVAIYSASMLGLHVRPPLVPTATHPSPVLVNKISGNIELRDDVTSFQDNESSFAGEFFSCSWNIATLMVGSELCRSVSPALGATKGINTFEAGTAILQRPAVTGD